MANLFLSHDSPHDGDRYFRSMAVTQKLSDWLHKAIEDREVRELTEFTVSKQIEVMDAVKTGIGLIIVLTPTYLEQQGEETKISPEIINWDVTSYPVVLMRGQWHVSTSDGLCDVISGVIRLLSHADME